MAKKYYWLKLNQNFFDNEEIKVIENMPNGGKYIIFYLKLLLKSISAEGKLMFRDVIPYTPDMLSSITGTDVDTVRVSIDIFEKLGLLEKLDDGALFMRETQNMIGAETEWAKKKREQRKKIGSGDNVPKLSEKCPTEKEIEKELDKEIELDKELLVVGGFSEALKEAISHYEKCGFGLANDKIVDFLETDIEIYGSEWVKEAMDIAVRANKYKLSYVEAILRNWRADGKKDKKEGKEQLYDFSRANSTNNTESKEEYRGEEINF